MAEKKKSVDIYSPKILHGKRARLVRGDNEVVGVLLSNDSQISSDNFVFQFVNSKGVKSISPVTKEELQNIEESLLDY